MGERSRDPVDPKVLHDTLLALTADVRAHFGDREPSDAEVRAFLEDRLRAEGRSEPEIEEILGPPQA